MTGSTTNTYHGTYTHAHAQGTRTALSRGAGGRIKRRAIRIV